jgi:hypothetical protein
LQLEIQKYRVLRLENVPVEDWSIAISMQGIVNRKVFGTRKVPLIYLLPRPDGPEKHWIEWYRSYGYEPVETTLDELLQSRAGRMPGGYIVFDPEVPDTLNVAISLAGVMDALVCPPSAIERMKSNDLGCQVDLRGKFKGRIEPYRWLIEEHLSKFDLKVMANYNQGDNPRAQADMDYLIAHGGFCMGLSVNSADYPEEAELWDRVQTAAPDHAIMIGWHTPRDSEATHVYFASQHNVRLFCGHAWNASFHQHVKASDTYSQEHCKEAKCDPNAKYVTITLSDGDSWHSMADVQKKFWLNPRRGEVPLGWEVAPIFAEAGPALLEYYFKTCTPNDYLVCGPSGTAYNYLSGYKDWKGFMEISRNLMEQTSLRTIWTINRIVRHVPGGGIEHRLKDGPIVYSRQQMEEFGGIKDQNGADYVDPEVISRFMEQMPDALGFFQGWERIPG